MKAALYKLPSRLLDLVRNAKKTNPFIKIQASKFPLRLHGEIESIN